MKNIKTFDSYVKLYEELDPSTYASAANKLKKLGHTERGEELGKYADLKAWEDNITKYGKYGTIEVDLVNYDNEKSEIIGKIECYPLISFDGIADDCGIMIGLIPTNEKELEKISAHLEDDEELNCGCGIFWFLVLGEDFYGPYGSLKNSPLVLSNRASATKLRKLIIDIFKDEIPDYPHFNIVSDEDRENMLGIVNDLSVNKMYIKH